MVWMFKIRFVPLPTELNQVRIEGGLVLFGGGKGRWFWAVND
jgi:hypothetical protein